MNFHPIPAHLLRRVGSSQLDAVPSMVVANALTNIGRTPNSKAIFSALCCNRHCAILKSALISTQAFVIGMLLS